jgi:Ca2+-binding EF-hand superfamily protein
VTKINVSSLKNLGKDILAAEYKTSLSQWRFETPKEVHERELEVDQTWIELDRLAAAKKAVLEEDLKRELRKEELRISFANLAGGFTIFAKDAISASKNHYFGNLLEEIEAFQAVLASQDKATTSRAAHAKTEYDKVYAELTQLEVKENPYTILTPADLEKTQHELVAALQARQEKFAEVLAKARADDALCRKFAALIDPFVKKIETNRHSLAENKESMEALLERANRFIAENKSDDTLAKIKAAQAEVDSAGILFNRHTENSAIDAEVMWDQYVLFLEIRAKQLETEIEHKKLRGVTPEQYKEIDNQFKTFDKNSNGTLDKREFKACLYSLGEEKGKREIGSIMEKFGSKDAKGDIVIKYESFKDFMIGILGDTDTQQEIVDGFHLINRGKESNDPKLMALVMEDPQRRG